MSQVPEGGAALRTLVVANKSWEADPLVAALSSGLTRPDGVGFTPAAGPRGFRGTATSARGPIEIWCLQEALMPGANTSSSAAKAAVLPDIVGRPDVGVVLAFGTAATVGPESLNGCVVIGTRTFVHDPKPPGSSSTWKPPDNDRLFVSESGEARFPSLFAPDFRLQVESRLLAPPLNPAPARVVLSGANYVALSDVNVVNYDDYAWADEETVRAFLGSGSRSPIGSLETTHAVIRTFTTAPFLFVSGIADRVGSFNAEVAPRTYAQNFVAAHNAAIALAFLVPLLPRTAP